MSQQSGNGIEHVGLFLNPVAQRRVDFQAACGRQFHHLFVAEDVAQAAHILAHRQVGLLVIDLACFDRGLDGAAIGRLVAQRHGLPVLLVCRFDAAGWLAELMAFGPLDYLIGPVSDAELGERLAAQRPATSADRDRAGEPGLAALAALRSRFQQAVIDADDEFDLAARACAVLCDWPGVAHAAMFQLSAAYPPHPPHPPHLPQLTLAAQHSTVHIDLASLLTAGQPLAQSPLRHSFPGLVAAFTGAFVCLDAPAKADDPDLAAFLGRMDVAMVVGVPILARGPGAPPGALSLMFGRAAALSRDALNTLTDLAQLAGFGLRMAETRRDGDMLLARLTAMATTDALTGVANRRHGETLLEQEIKRARRYQTPLALIAFDVDQFKAINDRYGHPCGDAALRIVAATTAGQLRTSDLLGRTGGDQFQIVATHTSAIDALKMAEKIRAAIAATVFPGCDRLTVSLAVAQAAGDESADALTLRVNAALARAKRAGRNCVELAMQ